MTTARASTLATLSRLVESARGRRSEVERMADRLAAVLVPVVAVVATVTFAVLLRTRGPEPAITAALAVLLVACPCSFGLAVPLVMLHALDHAASRGVVVRGADVLERAAKVRRVVFDKTGTLTDGVLEIVAVEAEDDLDSIQVLEVLAVAAALERGVRHPIASAIVGEADARNARRFEATHVEVVPGCGVSGLVDGVPVFVGRRSADVARRGGEVEVTWGSRHAVIVFGEHLRGEAREAVDSLRAIGVDVELASGDDGARACAIGRSLGIDVRGTLTPADKLSRIEALERAGEVVAMVGDGYNDGPALARASVGIAMGCGTEVAQGIAPVCLVETDLRRIPWLLQLARRARRVAMQNLAWALGYNAFFVALAATGHLRPVLAAIAMLGSSFAVLANSARLRTDSTPIRGGASSIGALPRPAGSTTIGALS